MKKKTCENCEYWDAQQDEHGVCQSGTHLWHIVQTNGDDQGVEFVLATRADFNCSIWEKKE